MLGLARHKSAVGEIDEAIEISDQALTLRRQHFGSSRVPTRRRYQSTPAC